MKKIIIISLILAVLVVAGLSAYYFVGGQRLGSSQIEAVLPENPVFYIHFSQISENLDTFAKTEFFKKLQVIDYEKLLRYNGVTDQQIAMVKQSQKQLTSPQAKQVLDKFFGQEVAMAFYGNNIDKIDIMNMNQIFSNFVFITRLKPQAQFAEFALGYVKEVAQDVSVEDVDYKEKKIRLIRSNDGQINIGYTRIGDLLVLGVGDNAAKMAIDVLKSGKGSLRHDKSYLRTKGDYIKQHEAAGYLNFAGLMAAVKDQVLKWTAPLDNQEMVAQQIERNLSQVKGIKSFGYSAKFDKVSMFKLDWQFNKEELNPVTRSIYECAPTENRTVALVPASILGYQWSACYDFKLYWNEMKKGLAQASAQKQNPNQPALSPDQIIAGLEQNLNFSIERDLLPSLGDEIGGYLTDVNISGPFPLPKILLFIELTNKDRVEQVINSLFESQPLFIPVKEEYKGHTVHFINIPLVKDLSPGYCLLDNYFLITTNYSMIKQSLDILNEDTPSIATQPKLKENKFDLTRDVNSVFFLDVAKTSKTATGLVDWANQWNSMQQSKQEAFRAGSEKRLRDVKSQIIVQQAELDVLREDLNALRERRQASGTESEQLNGVSGQGLTEKDYEMKIELKEKVVLELEDTQAELENILVAYDKGQERSLENQKALAENLLKPLLNALTSFQFLTSKVVFGKNVIESLIYWEVQ